MNIYETVFNTLTGLCGGRVYPNVAPDEPITPYIVYTRSSTEPHNQPVDLNNYLKKTRFQIDCFDKTYKAVDALSASVITAIKNEPTLQTIPLLEQDQYEPDLKIHHRGLEYSVFHF